MEAVARSRRRDAGLEALLQCRQSNQEAGPSNSDEEEVHLLPRHGLAAFPLAPLAAELVLGTSGCSAMSRNCDHWACERSRPADRL